MPVISIEGVNGAGKTTLLKSLNEFMPANALTIRSPGGTPAGEKIRNTVKAALARENTASPEELARLNVRGFALSITEIIEPALEEDAGRIILLDRWSESTHAYQGAQGVPAAYIDYLLTSINCLKPDMTLLLDADVVVAQSRHSPNAKMDDTEGAFKKRVREIYVKRAAQNPSTVVIDALDHPEIVFEKVKSQITELTRRLQC